MIDTRQFILSGPDQVQGANKARLAELNKENWPYVHVYPPPDSIPVHHVTTDAVAVPAIGSTAVALTYKVPSGYRFIMQAILQNVYLAAGAFAVGDITWTVDQNKPVGIGDTQGQPIQGLVAVPFPLGSYTSGNQWPFCRAYEFEPLSIIRSKATNVASAGAGAPNVLVSGFFGYLISTKQAKRS